MFSGLMDDVVKNGEFLLVVVVIIAVIIALAKICEVTFLKENVYRMSPAKYTAICGVMGAMAGILMMFEIPLVFLAPNFYKLDFSELPVMIGTRRKFFCRPGTFGKKSAIQITRVAPEGDEETDE